MVGSGFFVAAASLSPLLREGGPHADRGLEGDAGQLALGRPRLGLQALRNRAVSLVVEELLEDHLFFRLGDGGEHAAMGDRRLADHQIDRVEFAVLLRMETGDERIVVGDRHEQDDGRSGRSAWQDHPDSASLEIHALGAAEDHADAIEHRHRGGDLHSFGGGVNLAAGGVEPIDEGRIRARRREPASARPAAFARPPSRRPTIRASEPRRFS